MQPAVDVHGPERTTKPVLVSQFFPKHSVKKMSMHSTRGCVPNWWAIDGSKSHAIFNMGFIERSVAPGKWPW